MTKRLNNNKNYVVISVNEYDCVTFDDCYYFGHMIKVGVTGREVNTRFTELRQGGISLKPLSIINNGSYELEREIKQQMSPWRIRREDTLGGEWYVYTKEVIDIIDKYCDKFNIGDIKMIKPKTTVRDLRWLVAQDKEDKIIIPGYQRHLRWSTALITASINTMIQYQSIGLIYMRRTDNKLELIDGQQRYTNIVKRFITGNYSLNLSKLPSDHIPWTTDPELNNVTFTDLPEEIQNNILDTEIITSIFGSNMSENDARLHFSFINSNAKVVNTNEKDHARYHGKLMNLIKSYSDNDYLTESGIITKHTINSMSSNKLVSMLITESYHNKLCVYNDARKLMDEYSNTELPDTIYYGLDRLLSAMILVLSPQDIKKLDLSSRTQHFQIISYIISSLLQETSISLIKRNKIGINKAICNYMNDIDGNKIAGRFSDMRGKYVSLLSGEIGRASGLSTIKQKTPYAMTLAKYVSLHLGKPDLLKNIKELM